MAKKSRTAKVKIPFLEYSWYKEINQIETNKEFIQNQIDSFILLIENKDNVKIGDYRDELKAFTTMLPAQGHLSKLDKEYQEKYFRITKFVKDNFGFVGGTVSIG
ncbi:MAG: hypothetical protein ACFFDH_04455 [Promethearchaeota archaeon]